MDYFRGLIKCSFCNHNYNFRNNNGTKQFICGSVKNRGRSSCPNSPYIDYDYLLDIINRHCTLQGKVWKDEKAKVLIYRIEIGEEIVIRWKDSLVTRVGRNELIF